MLEELERLNERLDRMNVQLDEMLWIDGHAEDWNVPTCRGCGTLLRLRTKGCETCRKRHYSRKVRAR